MTYYRVQMNANVQIQGKRSFWMQVSSESATIVRGWEMTEDGDRTHRFHIIGKDNASFQPARMNHTYATMEIV